MLNWEAISSWVLRSRSRVLLAIVISFVAIGILKASLMLAVMTDASERHIPLLVVDAIVTGLLCSAIIGTILLVWHRRRRRVLHYVRQVDNLNHHVRNALQALVLHAEASSNEQRALLDTLQACVRRIDQTLRDVFPIVGDRKTDRGKTFHDLTD